jgi:hypothetical protein
MGQMNLLTDEELAQMTDLDRAIYSTLVCTVEAQPAASFLVKRDSGFFFSGPDDLIDDPYLVTMRLSFRMTAWPGLIATFNNCPEGLNFFASDMPTRLGCYDSWPMLLTDYSSESAFLQASSEFVSDWLNGETRVEIATANGVSYRWTIRRRGRQLWSHRSFLYPFWGKKALIIRACGVGAQGVGQENVSG